MRWAGTIYFNLFWFLPFIVLFFILAFRRKKKNLYLFAKAGILEKLTPSLSFRRQYIKAVIIVFAIIFIIFSLTRPQYGVKEELVTQKGIDIIVAVDTSFSMNAEDIKPNRLEKVKLSLKDFLGKLQGDRVGLVVFSGDAILYCPLTVDYSAVDMMTDIIDTNAIPKPGTNIERAIRISKECFKARNRQHKVLIIMTDGENLQGNPYDAAKDASKDGISIYTIGIGSPEGAPIPIKDEKGKIIDTKKDWYGKDVISKLDENSLKEIAKAGGGKYFRVSSSGQELEEICKNILSMEKSDFQSNLYSRYEDRFQYPLFLAFFLICIEFFIDERRTFKKSGGRFE
jgi:Ca-activated chloride channel family protein